jgi:16S rRNA (uracil1498-N3)-methyltransferase
VVDRGDRTPVATLQSIGPLTAGRPHTLAGDSAHHLRVVRASVGDVVALRDGAGCAALGTLVRLAKGSAVVDVDAVDRIDPLQPVHLLAPVADRERMLWLAEKATELGLTSWRPILWRRSRSVSPRGEGTMFQQKLRGRITAALLQSQGAWLPETFPDATVERAVAAAPEGTRILLDAAGDPLLSHNITGPVSIAVGPEGGVEPKERDCFVAGGFILASFGPNRLRFETAAIAALAVARAALAATASPPLSTAHSGAR